MTQNPKMYQKIKINDPCNLYIKQEKKMVQSMAYDPNKDLAEQKAAMKEKFLELLQMPEKLTNPVPIIECEDNSDPRFDEIRFVVETEPDFYVPAHMLIPKGALENLPEGSKGLPMVICLQGHTAGMHVSMAREAYPGKEPMEVQGDRDFAIQAIERGYATLVMEQRGFGELSWPAGKTCHMLSWQAALMGKTLLGARLHDICCMIDAVEAGFDFVDKDRIGIMGNSGGGTSSYYAACIDERIKVSMPSSSFCTIVDSWGSSHHCDCAYIPNMLSYMEMQDLAMLIAPRALVPVNGIYDHIQPFEAVKVAYKTAKEIYAAAGAPDNIQLVVGTEGHRFYAAQGWPVFDEFMKA